MAWGDHHGRAVAAVHDAQPAPGCAGCADTAAEYGRVVAVTVTRRFPPWLLGRRCVALPGVVLPTRQVPRDHRAVGPAECADNRGELKEEIWIWTM
jgi:hypothetical protein